VALLIQDGDQYEVVSSVAASKGIFKDTFRLDTQRLLGIQHITSKTLGAGGCGDNDERLVGTHAVSAPSIAHALALIDDPAVVQVIGYDLTCIGLITGGTGVYVPLPVPDAIVLDYGLKLVYFEDMAVYLTPRQRDEEANQSSGMFQRLAAVLQNPLFEPVRTLRHRDHPDSVSLLLRMGRVCPLTLPPELFASYQRDLNAFVNVPYDDARVANFRQLSAERNLIASACSMLLRSAQADLETFRNITEVLSERCTLPWDVRHSYLVWLTKQLHALGPGVLTTDEPKQDRKNGRAQDQDQDYDDDNYDDDY
jgi:hypothetical protein